MKFTVNGYNYVAKTSTFPGGEEFVQLVGQLPLEAGSIIVHADLRSSQSIMQLLMLTDALRRYDVNDQAKFYLDLTYLPYARQDRVCAKGESFSLKVMCGLINNLNYDRVYVADVHSDVGTALLDNVFASSQLDTYKSDTELNNIAQDCDVIIAPDAGAAKKAQAIADYYNKPLVQCLKTRKGNTIVVDVLGNVTGKRCLVVDDICDGGGTFLALASAINSHEPSELHLRVTHGIFSKGKAILEEHYETVGAFDDWTT